MNDAERLAAYDAREPLVREVFEAIASSEDNECISSLKVDVPKDGYPRQWMRLAVQEHLAERQATSANLEVSPTQPDTPDAHVGEPSAAVNAAIYVACIDRGPASGRQRRVFDAAYTLGKEVERLRREDAAWREINRGAARTVEQLVTELAELRKAVSEVDISAALRPILGAEPEAVESGESGA